jgi:hypothetical protein
MKKLVFLFVSVLAFSSMAKEMTVYPRFHGKKVTKLCYNEGKDNFTYWYKNLFGKYKYKTISRIQYKKGDCTKYDYVRRGGRDGEMRRICVERAPMNIMYPLTVVAKVYDVETICHPGSGRDRDEDRCHQDRTLVRSFEYTIKACR